MAIVLVILGFMVSGLLVPLSASMDQMHAGETQARLQRATETLLGFAAAYGRLPCPDTDNDGYQETACAGIEGTLPWATLGLSRADGLDGWGFPLRYVADATFVTLPIPASPATVSGLAVQDLSGTPVTGPDPNAPAALLLSRGKDGAGNGDNGDSDLLFTQSELCLSHCALYFDDMLGLISKHLVLSRLVLAGKWPN